MCNKVAQKQRNKKTKQMGKKSNDKKKKNSTSKKSIDKNLKKFITLKSLITKAKQALKKSKPNNIETAINIANIAVKRAKRGKKVKKSRIIPLPYTGGDLDLIPTFVGLNENGSLLNGKKGEAIDIIDAINHCRNMQKPAQRNADENDVTPTTPKAVELRRNLYLYPYKTGYGLYCQHKKPTHTKKLTHTQNTTNAKVTHTKN